MSEISITSTVIGNQLLSMLMADDIQVGSQLSYQLCKDIYLYHPLGSKIVDLPILKALNSPRNITVPESPENLMVKAFNQEWKALKIDQIIANIVRQGRIYGVGSCVLGVDDDETETNAPLNLDELYKLNIFFNVIDPLGTAGSLITSQDQNNPDFQLIDSVRVAGKTYHPSRVIIFQNEKPIFLSFTASAYGFVGRSVYTRALYPLKSFVQSMITDNTVTQKAGLLIMKTKKPGSVIDRLSTAMDTLKRTSLKGATTGNVLSIEREDAIETLNMQNTHTCMEVARKNVLENIAAAAGLPAKLLSNETFTTGFGEGNEDAQETSKELAEYIDWFRNEMQPIMDFFDLIVQYRAWNPEFYATIQIQFPSYHGVSYQTAFNQWRNSFSASWENVLKESDSEKIKVEEVKFKAITDLLIAIYDKLDPENKASIMKWAEDNLNENTQLFPNPMELDYDSLRSYEPPQKQQEMPL